VSFEYRRDDYLSDHRAHDHRSLQSSPGEISRPPANETDRKVTPFRFQITIPRIDETFNAIQTSTVHQSTPESKCNPPK
jgi:hypothetical protein